MGTLATLTFGLAGLFALTLPACDSAIYSANIGGADAAGPRDAEATRDANTGLDGAQVGDTGAMRDAGAFCNSGWAEGRSAGSFPPQSGKLPWINPQLAQNLDGAYASASNMVPLAETTYLYVEDFGLRVPNSAKISGIEAEVTRNSSFARGIRDLSVQLYADEFSKADRRNSTLVWGLETAAVTYGAANDLWGSTWTPASVNDAGFSVVIAVNFLAALGAGVDTPNVDRIRIRVSWICP